VALIFKEIEKPVVRLVLALQRMRITEKGKVENNATAYNR